MWRLLLFAVCVEATLTMPPYLGSHMVLQEGDSVVWGRTSHPYGLVHINHEQAQADGEGHWRHRLEVANDTLVVADADSQVVYVDVVYGDVLLCSGQSNMVRTSVLAGVRVLGVNGWTSEPTAFSTVCGVAGLRVQEATGRTVGMVVAAVNGSPIELWSSPSALAACAHTPLSYTVSQIGPMGALWRERIEPLLLMRFRMVLWYQGETNFVYPDAYACRFPALIVDWRARFDAPMPFVFVQIAGFVPPASWRRHDTDTDAWVQLQLAQTAALALPDIGMATAMDLGDADNVHPPNQYLVGERVSLVVRRLVYHHDVVDHGPLLVSVARRTLTFDSPVYLHGTQGCDICCNESPFEVRVHGLWSRAGASTEGSVVHLAVSPRGVVRYAYASFAQCALYNQQGLAAGPWVHTYSTMDDVPAGVVLLLPLMVIAWRVVQAPHRSSHFLFEASVFFLHAIRTTLGDRGFETLAPAAVSSFFLYWLTHNQQRPGWAIASVGLTASIMDLDHSLIRVLLLIPHAGMFCALLLALPHWGRWRSLGLLLLTASVALTATVCPPMEGVALALALALAPADRTLYPTPDPNVEAELKMLRG